jgi:hypothetical protein
MKQETEINIKIRESRTNEKGIPKINQTVELECLYCGCSWEQYYECEQRLLNDNLVSVLSEYINDGYICEDCQKGDSE